MLQGSQQRKGKPHHQKGIRRENNVISLGQSRQGGSHLIAEKLGKTLNEIGPVYRRKPNPHHLDPVFNRRPEPSAAERSLNLSGWIMRHRGESRDLMPQTGQLSAEHRAQGSAGAEIRFIEHADFKNTHGLNSSYPSSASFSIAFRSTFPDDVVGRRFKK